MKKLSLLIFALLGLSMCVTQISCDRQETIVKKVEKQFKSDHIILDKFDAWKVRHVFDKDSLIYRYSDAKTMIKLSIGEEFPFQFIKPNDPLNDTVYYGIPGYIDEVVLEIDGEIYEETQSGLHNFYGIATDEILNAVANTRNEIKITFYSADDVFTGTIDPAGASAALKWIRVIE